VQAGRVAAAHDCQHVFLRLLYILSPCARLALQYSPGPPPFTDTPGRGDVWDRTAGHIDGAPGFHGFPHGGPLHSSPRRVPSEWGDDRGLHQRHGLDDTSLPDMVDEGDGPPPSFALSPVMCRRRRRPLVTVTPAEGEGGGSLLLLEGEGGDCTHAVDCDGGGHLVLGSGLDGTAAEGVEDGEVSCLSEALSFVMMDEASPSALLLACGGSFCGTDDGGTSATCGSPARATSASAATTRGMLAATALATPAPALRRGTAVRGDGTALSAPRHSSTGQADGDRDGATPFPSHEAPGYRDFDIVKPISRGAFGCGVRRAASEWLPGGLGLRAQAPTQADNVTLMHVATRLRPLRRFGLAPCVCFDATQHPRVVALVHFLWMAHDRGRRALVGRTRSLLDSPTTMTGMNDACRRVYLARKRDTGALYAMKVLSKATLLRKNMVDQVVTERDAMALVTSPFIVRLCYSFRSPTAMYLVRPLSPSPPIPPAPPHTSPPLSIPSTPGPFRPPTSSPCPPRTLLPPHVYCRIGGPSMADCLPPTVTRPRLTTLATADHPCHG